MGVGPEPFRSSLTPSWPTGATIGRGGTCVVGPRFRGSGPAVRRGRTSRLPMLKIKETFSSPGRGVIREPSEICITWNPPFSRSWS
ncbi:hypothetical protein FRB94_009633 [Tulasnella sp. JGI-2019a]|nr:hypothetical protein FRB94_009633 [Tulasnella sp. JGI-2019a]